jgi:hypothetical protein
MYPPVVSVAGFANVDRGMFRAVSDLTKELECFKKELSLILLRNSFKIDLKISAGRLVPVLLDRLMYCSGTFTHISVSFFLSMDVQKLGILETPDVLLHGVPTYEKNNIFMTTRYSVLNYFLKIITTISMLFFGIKQLP